MIREWLSEGCFVPVSIAWRGSIVGKPSLNEDWRSDVSGILIGVRRA